MCCLPGNRFVANTKKPLQADLVLFVLVANVTFTSRTCAPSSSGKPCTIIEATLVGLGGSIQDCYTCQTDYCNSSNSLTGASILVALAIVFQLFFSKS